MKCSILFLILFVGFSSGFFYRISQRSCNSDRECPAIRRRSSYTRFLGIFTARVDSLGEVISSGRCLTQSDGLCQFGNFLSGGRNSCNVRRCAQCFSGLDCTRCQTCDRNTCAGRCED
ncbi:uncharacterized protein LOC111702389 [Eurytemora carolleeae]|uniref:uncharacterized protein LOC111702389 n=1 Tax=Eurytemora carolleeae TaxID=1294199 RepID=UPI000C770EC2|nr:uncharacterized protein LOC111702389 [Eurytemora carolleeae]|eukprot:XP_023329824.1 uncharacterized protein LOC111702389 [Eurytemora affinis]